MPNPARESAVERLRSWLRSRFSVEGRAERLGHVVTEHVHWIDMDDSSGYVSCTCGFSSREAKVCWLMPMADQHRRNVLGLARQLPGGFGV